jgi:hypothetical protein
MDRRVFFALVLAATALLAGAAGAAAQIFSLDDDPSFPLTFSPATPPFRSSEDPFGLGHSLGVVGPSPSLAAGPFVCSDLLNAGPALDVSLAQEWYVDALSANHTGFFPANLRLRFSVDRLTTGLAGTAVQAQFARNQQPADLFDTTVVFPHPCSFLPLGPGPFAGVLPTAGAGVGGNVLAFNQNFFGLLPAVGPGVFAGAIGNGTHDNIDAYNDLPVGALDVTGDGVTDADFYYTFSPANAAILGVSPSTIFDLAAGAAVPIPAFPPFAGPPAMGLDALGGPRRDDIDGLVVWDQGPVLGPHWGGPGAQPGVDCAIFSLSPDSGTIPVLRAAGLPVDAATVFVTDFSGAFAIYLYAVDLGITIAPGFNPAWANVDALEVRLP